MLLYKFFTTLSCDLNAKHMRNEKVRFPACFILLTMQQILVKFVSVRTEPENLSLINFGP
jgi:hypothetical protein